MIQHDRPSSHRQPLSLREKLQLAPLLLVMLGLFGGALVLGLLQSFGFAPWFGINEFPNPDYFVALWSSPDFWLSLGLTLYYGVVSTLLGLIISVPLALAFERRFCGSKVLLAVSRLPLMVPYSVGIALALIMLGNGGIISRLAASLGLISDPGAFPAILHSHWGWGIIAVYVWKQVPFMTMAILAVLLGLGQGTREAAMVLGARTHQVFWRVTLPQLMPGIVSASLICFAFNVGAFEAPFILGGGYPETLPVLAWRYFNDANYVYQLQGMAVIVSLTLVSGVILAGYLFAYRRFERKRGRL
ncbi:sugar ABC transporter permease [Pseudovibrio exalbescens]|uniref:ABC transporter permease n=1 Tax=Pseudovibrio exalbescens TaxID=197461 RepID=UPI0023655AE5|nr:sugar ABC transporter permease [Pseudovibrio exalbescens]MDD7909856.1 sugar ABC transporter permease [Pseudovibrio exalbescens]